MIKRLTALLTLVFMLLLLLTACGRGNDNTPAPAPGSESSQEKEDTTDPLVEAESEFSTAVQDLSSAQSELSGLLPEAEKLLEDVTPDELSDASLLEQLQTILEIAMNTEEISVPEMKSEAEEVRTQTQDIVTQVNKFRTLCRDVRSAISAVRTDKQEFAEEKRRNSITPKGKYVGKVKDIVGYEAEYTVSVTDWIKASDTELLQLAWEEVAGNESTVPPISHFQTTTGDGFAEAYAAVAFGVISLRNVTEGFDITEENPVTFTIGLGSSLGEYSINTPKMYVKFTEPKTLDFGRYASISPLMKSNKWGPVAFMLAVPNVLIPKDPDGTVLDDFTLYFTGTEGTEIVINRSW